MVPTRRDNVAFTVVVTVLVVLGALPILLVIALSGGPDSLVLATVLAALPVGPLVACYLWLDRYEPEPRSLLLLGLLWGGFVATAAALLVQGIGGLFVGVTEAASLAMVAPVTEELFKGAFLVLLLWWRRAELDGVLDGIVYAGMVGIGFAFVENILYLAAAYNGTDGMGPGGTEALTDDLRGALPVQPVRAPLLHHLHRHRGRPGGRLALHRGAGAGPAGRLRPRGARPRALERVDHLRLRRLRRRLRRADGRRRSWPSAVLAVWARRSERRMLAAALGDAAQRGLLPATDIGWVVDLGARRRARSHARRLGGAAGERAMLDYQQAVIELGFLHHRYLRGTPPPDFALRGQDYVARIRAVRPSIAFPGQVVPTR